MELVCSFMDGGGLRIAGEGRGGSFSDSGSRFNGVGSVSFLEGDSKVDDEGTRDTGFEVGGISVGSSPSYTLSRSIFGGKPSAPSNHSAADMAGFVPTTGGYMSP